MRIKLTKAKTINTGNYENVKIEIGIEEDIEKSDFKDEYGKYNKLLDVLIAQEIEKHAN